MLQFLPTLNSSPIIPSFLRLMLVRKDSVRSRLAQQQADGKVHPIVLRLSMCERISELETLGLVWATKAYLLGHQCVVITDLAACTSPLNSLHPCWSMEVQEFDLDIRHRSGKSNVVADALSHNPVPVADVFQIVADLPTCEAQGGIGKLQNDDSYRMVLYTFWRGS